MTNIKTKLLWFIHNVISHPIYGVLRVIGLNQLAQWVHDITVPEDA